MTDNGLMLALVSIFVIALLTDFYPPLGWGLAILAALAMIGNYYQAKGTV